KFTFLKRYSADVGWEYGALYDPLNPDKVKCKLCGKEISGGIHRLKQHIAHKKGVVASSQEDKDKCMKALNEAKEKKSLKRRHEDDLRSEVNVEKQATDELGEELGTMRSPHFQGPIDKFASCIDPEASLATRKRQQSIHDAISKEKTHVVCQQRTFLGCFVKHWDSSGLVGQYQLREALLNEEVLRTQQKVKILEEEWEREGCFVMTDAWTDMKRRSIMNLCVNSRDLMLEGVSMLPNFAKVISQAKAATVFIYAHDKTLSMMRAYTKKRDIIRPGATRFATCFLTLHSMYDKKAQLKAMFTSDEWYECTHSKTLKGKNTFDTVMSFGFWNSVMMVLKIFSPLVKVPRLADGEKIPSMERRYLQWGNLRSTYGSGAPTLQKLATRILALNSSSSDCERNWSCFESIHTKKRNRLNVNSLNNLVYVQFNAKLFNKQKRIREQNVDAIFEDGNEDTVEEWIAGPRLEDQDSEINLMLATQAPRTRDIYDDDFDSEPEDAIDMEFEPDKYQEVPRFGTHKLLN
ncbi:hypothetical protein EUTSA_v10002303mg, partial [Eutrema salsugineum]